MNCIPNKNIIRFLIVLTGARLDATLTPFIEEVMKAYDLPGFAIGVVKDNEIVYARGFGTKNIDTKKPVTTTTFFHMASISDQISWRSCVGYTAGF